MMWLWGAILGGASMACDEVRDVPEEFQVAWISPVRQRARRTTTLEVVRVADLREWIQAHSNDGTRVLRALGMLDQDERMRRDYKITIFDVRNEWLCRPMEVAEIGERVGGVVACEEDQHGPSDRFHAAGYTGCGHTMDTHASARGLDVFRVKWIDASSAGFCVLPLARFLEGA